jgi:hypothetical protein
LYSNSKNCHCFCRFHGHCNWLHLHMQLSRIKKNRRPVLFCFEFPLNPFKSSLTGEIDTHEKGAILQNFKFFNKIYGHTQKKKNLDARSFQYTLVYFLTYDDHLIQRL